MSPILPKQLARSQGARQKAFTLVEVMISAGLSAIVLSGILTTFLMLGRSGYNASNYSVMEAQARRALETFSIEARQARNIVTASDGKSIMLTVTTGSSTYDVTYAYDSSSTGTTAKSFYRVLGSLSSTSPKLILVNNIEEFAFRRYKIVNGVDFTAINDLETKQIQITLRSIRTGVTAVEATNAVLSARVVLRNKQVTT